MSIVIRKTALGATISRKAKNGERVLDLRQLTEAAHVIALMKQMCYTIVCSESYLRVCRHGSEAVLFALFDKALRKLLCIAMSQGANRYNICHIYTCSASLCTIEDDGILVCLGHVREGW